MPRIPRSITGGVVYHILNRANSRETIFKEEIDFYLFEKILLEGKKKFLVDIFSFSVTSNHRHFVLSAKIGRDISDFMRWITHTHTQSGMLKIKP